LSFSVQVELKYFSRAKERNAHVLQLTTDKKRHKALKFYKKTRFYGITWRNEVTFWRL